MYCNYYILYTKIYKYFAVLRGLGRIFIKYLKNVNEISKLYIYFWEYWSRVVLVYDDIKKTFLLF